MGAINVSGKTFADSASQEVPTVCIRWGVTDLVETRSMIMILVQVHSTCYIRVLCSYIHVYRFKNVVNFGGKSEVQCTQTWTATPDDLCYWKHVTNVYTVRQHKLTKPWSAPWSAIATLASRLETLAWWAIRRVTRFLGNRQEFAAMATKHFIYCTVHLSQAVTVTVTEVLVTITVFFSLSMVTMHSHSPQSLPTNVALCTFIMNETNNYMQPCSYCTLCILQLRY